MLSLRKINPMVRAVGTMGAIAAVAGGVTFATLSSNTVALTNNTFSSSTAALQISNDNLTYGNNATGPTATLTPGTPNNYTFYLKNNGTTPLSITASVPTDVSTSQIPAAEVTLALDCGSGPVSYTLDQWAAGSAVIPGGALGAGSAETCTETVTLASSYSGQGGENVKKFSINFVGNQ